MHQLLEILILKPNRLQRLDGDNPLARQLLDLAKASHNDQFWTILNSYLYWTTGHQHTATTILPKKLFTGIKDIDDLFHQVTELYKAATDRVPPTRQDLIYVGVPLTVKHPAINSTVPPLVLVRESVLENGTITIGATGELYITIIHP